MYDGFISYSHAADDLLAPRLQAGLQRFAKPWWKRRAVRIFRDESSLSANPHLWSSITEALDTSGWFVLLLSPDAARSEWVNQEIEYWVENRDPKKILPVVTDGTFGWADSDVVGDVVPNALQGVFEAEPRWVDLRFAHGEEQLDLQNPTFSAVIADIAIAIRGVPKDELESEEVLQHRRTVRTAWAAGLVTAALAVAAVGFGIDAGNERNRADDEAARATAAAEQEAQARALAEANAQAEAAARLEADTLASAEAEARADAQVSAEEAELQAQLARARELAAASGEIRQDDPELATLLGLVALAEADEESVPIEIAAAFRRALYSLQVTHRMPTPGGEEAVNSALSPDGNYLVVLSEATVSVRVFDTTTWELVWTYSEPDSWDYAAEVHFSVDGSQVLFSVADASTPGFEGSRRQESDDGKWARIVVLDGSSGERLRTLEFDGPCSGVVLGPQSPDGRWWPIVSSDDPNCPFDPGTWELHLYEAESFERRLLMGVASPGNISWSADSNRIGFNSYWGPGMHVWDIATGELLFQEPQVWFGQLSPDGTRVATSGFGNLLIHLWDVQTGALLDRLEGPTDITPAIRFSADGTRLVAGSRADGVFEWNLLSGRTIRELRGVSDVVAMDIDEKMQLLHVVGAREVVTYDLSGTLEGELETELASEGTQADSFDAEGSVGTGLGFLSGSDEWHLFVFDAEKGGLTGAVAPVELGRSAAVLPDGRIALYRRDGEGLERVVGPVSLWNPVEDTYVDLVGCSARQDLIVEVELGVSDAPCLDEGGVWFDEGFYHYDPSTDRLLVSSYGGTVLLFDGTTLEPLDELSEVLTGTEQLEAFGGDWIAVVTGSPAQPAVEVRIVSIPELEELALLPGGQTSLSNDRTRLAVADRRGGFTVYDTSTWETVVEGAAGDARTRGLAFSPDDSKLMTTGTDSVVRVWEMSTGTEIHRIPIGYSGDGHWLDEEHIFIEFNGFFTTISLDLGELAGLALERLTRGLSHDECSAYRIDPCPSLEEMMNR